MLHWLKDEWRILLENDPQALLKAVEHYQDTDALFCRALAYQAMGEGTECEKFLKMALQRDLQHFPSVYVLGLRFLKKGRDREAKNYLRRGLRLDRNAAQTSLHLLKEIRGMHSHSPRSVELGVWMLRELVPLRKQTGTTQFHLGKLLFEKSSYDEAVPHLLEALEESDFCNEATEYLSYIYEHLYKGEELIDKTLQLAEIVKDRSDLFFNLAMVCQHDQRHLELALHFFYLAAKEDPSDPGLKFSLEQAAIEMMNQAQKSSNEEKDFLLMLAHLYQGSLGVAKRYAQKLKDHRFPDSFESRMPQRLWQKWLLTDTGILGQALQSWFGGSSSKIKALRALTRF